MPLLTTLALVAPLTHAAPPAPLAECEVVNRDATSALLICRNWMASAAHLRVEGDTWDAMVAAHMAGLELGSGATLGEAQTPRTVAGRPFLSSTITMGDAAAPQMVGTIVWPAKPAATLDVFSCMVTAQDPEGAARCDAALAALVTGGVPEGLPAHDPAIPSIIGRPVPVAEGCAAQADPAAGMINCMSQGGGSLQWMKLVAPGTPEELTALREGSLRELQTMRPGTWTTEEIACSIEDAPGTCWRFSQEGEAPQRRSLVAYALFRGIPLVAKCLYRGEAGALPAPCAEILAF
ncbi:MAG: hypothetical protein ABIO70_28300 [Pseudomonadota bacterium]